MKQKRYNKEALKSLISKHYAPDAPLPLTVVEIAKRAGCSISTVTNCAAKLGLPMRGKGNKLAYRPDEMEMLRKRDMQIAMMRKEGKTLDEIGKKYGVSRQRVHQIMSRGN